MALFGSLDTVHSQLAGSPAFAVAFDYLARCLTAGSVEAKRIAAIPEGTTERVALAEGVFALEQVYCTKPDAEAKWEAHERYIDMQVVIAGTELMGVRHCGELTRTEDYRAERDLAFFAPKAGGSVLRVQAGEVAVFFPVDAHRPSLADERGPAVVRKTVVKVPVAGAARL